MKNKCADGLRGIAALSVAVAHFVAAFIPMMLHGNYPTMFNENPKPSHLFEILTSPVISIFYNGEFAVLIFFVLSGYVLALPFFTDANNCKSILKKRLLARYLRLNIPIAAAILISYLVYKLGLYYNVQAAEISGSANWLKGFFPDGITVLSTAKQAIYESIFFGNGTLIPPLRTLKIEFIGSLYVLLFYIAKPLPPPSFCLFLLFVLIVLAVHRQDSIYYFAIFAGSMLGSLKKIYKYKFLLLPLGFYFGGFQFKSAFYNFLPDLKLLNMDIWGEKALYNALGAVLISLPIIQGFGSKTLEGRFVQFLGGISFSFYLVHFIALCSLSCFVYISLPQNKFFLGLNLVLYIVVCFVTSIIFARTFDKWAINISHKFSFKIFS